MIRQSDIDRRFSEDRMRAKSLDETFRRRIEAGANCAPFVSRAILREMKYVYNLEHDGGGSQLASGQVRMTAISAQEPPGKPLDECQKVCVTLTLDAGGDDAEVHAREGIAGLRRSRLLRMTHQAWEQGGLLSYEDLALRLLGCSVRTIIRDAKALRERGLFVPTRGQQKDMGPRQSHRLETVRLFLKGHGFHEIARRLFHSLSSIENYVGTFARVIILSIRGYTTDEIAFIIHRSSALVSEYLQLYHLFAEDPAARGRLNELLEATRRRCGPIPIKKGGVNR